MESRAYPDHMGATFSPRSDEHEAQVLAQLADGSLPERERPAVEAYVATSSAAQQRLADQVMVVGRLRAGGPAMSDALRARLDEPALRERRGLATPPRRERRGLSARGSRRWLAAPAALAAAVAVVLVWQLSGSSGTPTIGQAAQLAYVNPTGPSPAPDTSSPGHLDASFAGVPFPDYVRAFGAHPAGQRTDRPNQRAEQTVYYALPGGARISYTVVSGSPLPLPGVPVRTELIEGVAIRAYSERNLNFVTLVRSGRTCVLAGRVPASTLLALAAEPLRAATANA
jgi:anti-sigma factor RsiW